ncbi:hypothetical protein GQX74_014747 [Glossina fuscipes]|nr:hypothetical protein GQX74_014747 [Glossina fuscipes]
MATKSAFFRDTEKPAETVEMFPINTCVNLDMRSCYKPSYSCNSIVFIVVTDVVVVAVVVIAHLHKFYPVLVNRPFPKLTECPINDLMQLKTMSFIRNNNFKEIIDVKNPKRGIFIYELLFFMLQF